MMWHVTLHGSTHITQREDMAPRSSRAKVVLCQLELIARAAISTGVVRRIKAWNFARHEPKKGPKLKPHTALAHPPHDVHHTFLLKRPGIYLADSVNAHGERVFCFFLLTAPRVTVMTRQEVCEHFYLLQGREELESALTAQAWTRAWMIAQQAPASDLEASLTRCMTAVREALREVEEVALQGQPKQIQWAEPLRQKAMRLLRVTWRSLAAHPTLPAAEPRLLYAMVTCAWALKTQPRAELFIAADYHISHARIAELIDRFSALGKYHAGPLKSLAPPLSEHELTTLQRLAGAINP